RATPAPSWLFAFLCPPVGASSIADSNLSKELRLRALTAIQRDRYLASPRLSDFCVRPARAVLHVKVKKGLAPQIEDTLRGLGDPGPRPHRGEDFLQIAKIFVACVTHPGATG